MKSSAFCLLIIVEILAILVCVFLWEKWNSNHEVNRIIVLDGTMTNGTTNGEREIKNEEISIDNRMQHFISSSQNVTTNDNDMISTEDKISGIEDNKTNTKFGMENQVEKFDYSSRENDENEGKNAKISIDSRMQNLFTTTNDSKENAKIKNENHNKEFDDFEGNGNVITTTEDVIETTESRNESLSAQLMAEKVADDLIPSTNDVITNAKEVIINSENGIKNTNETENESKSIVMYDTTDF
ncbi:uncharacterized protein LOC122498237 isoform X2 [Leptopilina heterotoma]|uniref:uncharacterized protein LOC122498237 isoform X2 n=1 Tax=Leptopilina heterotoma TaxID=63436 RepID=UPI001CA97FCF|nr:uncharacterized protein LOC122498237 isoform X2 [Leptopilina heterotoma]